MAKTVARQRIKAVMTKHGGPPFSLSQKEGASQVFAVGEFVKFSSGELVIVTTDATIYGVAHGDDVFPPNTRAEGTPVNVWLGTPSTVFAGNLTEGNSVDHVLVQADVGTIVGFAFDTSNRRVTLDATNSSPSTLKAFIHGPCGGEEGEIGDTNARVLFTFIPSSLQDQA